MLALTIQPVRMLGSMAAQKDPSPLKDAVWHLAGKPGDGLAYEIAPASLSGARYLTFEMLLDGLEQAVFMLALREGDKGRAFNFHFGLLNQCSARIRMPIAALDLNRWMLDREGAFLKPICGGSRVDPAKVDRITLTLLRKGDADARLCITPLLITEQEVPPLQDPILPRGPVLDELGQSAHRDWPGKTRSEKELVGRLQQQLADAPKQKWPAAFSKWGGDAAVTLPGKGKFFRTHHDGKRWYLVDPDGHPFFSAGQDCVRCSIDANFRGLEKALTNPPSKDGPLGAMYGGRRAGSIDYLRGNFIRAFGADKYRQNWADMVLAELRRTGFNTVGNWSEWEIAAAAKFPYVRPLDARALRVGYVYRDFPDVFSEAFARGARDFARQLESTRDDPALIGYFLMNEPTWGFSSELPAVGMLYNTPQCETRGALAKHLRQKYADDASLQKAWGMTVTLAQVERGPFKGAMSQAALAELGDFSTVMVEKLFRTLSEACRAVDANHLNLGARYHTVPPPWALKGMTTFDVFSINCYQERVPAQPLKQIEAVVQRPTVIGEFHFGAMDVGLPASGIGRVATQADRGRAYRIYLENAASIPQCVGVHHFTMYDQSALGRFDGENYNIGFHDICHRPYEGLCDAARIAHERLYAVLAGKEPPFADAPKHLPKVFL